MHIHAHAPDDGPSTCQPTAWSYYIMDYNPCGVTCSSPLGLMNPHHGFHTGCRSCRQVFSCCGCSLRMLLRFWSTAYGMMLGWVVLCITLFKMYVHTLLPHVTHALLPHVTLGIKTLQPLLQLCNPQQQKDPQPHQHQQQGMVLSLEQVRRCTGLCCSWCFVCKLRQQA